MATKQFSALLVQDNVVPMHKVEEAFQRQVLFGGRLGTNLIEIGAIDEETLLRYLSQSTGLPWADRSLLTTVDWQAVELLSPDQIKRFHVLPLQKEGNVVKAVVTDPLSGEERQQLKEFFSEHVQQHITSEFRFYALLEQLFDEPLQKRFRLLNERFPIDHVPEAPHEVDETWELMTTNFGVRSKSSGRNKNVTQLRFGSSASPPEPGEPVSVRMPVFIGEEQNEKRRPRDVAAPDPGVTYEAFVSAARNSSSRDEVLASFCQFAASVARRCLLLLVSGPRLRGYLAAGVGTDQLDVRTVSVRVRDGGDIAQVCDGASYYQGPLDVPELQAVYNQIGLVTPPEAVALPIQLGPRVVMLAVIDNEQQGFGEDLTVLFRAVYRVSEALERLLMEYKQQKVPSDANLFSGQREPTRRRAPSKSTGAQAGIPGSQARRKRSTREATGSDRAQAADKPPRARSNGALGVQVESVPSPPEYGEEGVAESSTPFPDISSSIIGPANEVSTGDFSAPDTPGDAQAGRSSGDDSDTDDSDTDASWLSRGDSAAPITPQLDGGATGMERPFGDVDDIPVDVPVEEQTSSERFNRTDPGRPVRQSRTGSSRTGSSRTGSSRTGSSRTGRSPSDSDLRRDESSPGGARHPNQFLSPPTPLPPSDDSDAMGFASIPHSSIFVMPDDAVEDEELELIDDIEPVSIADANLPVTEAEPDPGSRPQIPDVPAEDVQFWVEQLDARDRAVSARAVEVLSIPNPDAVDALMQRFPGRLRIDRFHHDRDMPPAAKHSRILGCLVAQGKLAESRLIGLLPSSSADERFYALLTLGEMNSDELLGHLWNRIFDKDPQIRIVALRALRGNSRHPLYDEVLEMLCDATGDDDERTVTLALRALGELRNMDYIETVLPLLNHENSRIAEVARQTAAAISLEDPGSSVKKWEKWLAQDDHTSRIERIAEAMVHKERQLRVYAAEELAEFPGLTLNYHPDSNKRDRMRARDVFLEWAQENPSRLEESNIPFSQLGFQSSPGRK